MWFQIRRVGHELQSVTVVSEDGVVGVAFDDVRGIIALLESGQLQRLWPRVSADRLGADATGVYLQVVELREGPTVRARYNATTDIPGRHRVTFDVDTSAWLLQRSWAAGRWYWPVEGETGTGLSEVPGGP